MQILQVKLQTKRLKQLYTFYKEVLELPVSAPDKSSISIRIHDSELIFTKAKAMDPFYHFAITIPPNKIEEARDWMATRSKLIWIEDYQSDIADFKNWNAKSIYFFDPGGNIVELIARSGFDNETNEAFSSKDLLSISEIGMVSPEEYMDEKETSFLNLGLDYYSRQKPLRHFRVMGDDNGLLIIVPEGRNWYPTAVPAKCFPLAVTFNQGNTEYEVIDERSISPPY
jgi:hypothetical protein